ncbi:LysR family transcriptional regulator [Microbacterium terrisoli]|uniref:LysR family transcriptional regulator n=1 Tax=Microbacterium terrisoli TaxID=3242192 RepID=UPI0028053030|nr:LysR substrate-binding domain-containing protein [Microbacterium protaetiae]
MDLNLLRTFMAVYEARSLTGAASALHVTQSAVSQAMSRLRRDVADQLFYRSGRVMLPTPYAQELFPVVRDALGRIENAVSAQAFDPAASGRRFRIALSELGEMHWLAGIVERVCAAGPGLSVDVLKLDPTSMADTLARGVVDVAINSANVPGGFQTWTLKYERYVVLMAAGNPLATGELDMDAYRSAPHAVVTGESGHVNIERAVEAHGGAGDPVAVLNHFAALPAMLSATNLIATMPQSLSALWVRDWPLVMRDLPFALDPVQVRLYMRSAHQEASSLLWFRDVVLAATEAESGFAPVPSEPALPGHP